LAGIFLNLHPVRISVSRMPRVVRAGVPMRMPEGLKGRSVPKSALLGDDLQDQRCQQDGSRIRLGSAGKAWSNVERHHSPMPPVREASKRARRRTASTARKRPVVTSQARGLAGKPSGGRDDFKKLVAEAEARNRAKAAKKQAESE
jgi:hypothetical protein